MGWMKTAMCSNGKKADNRMVRAVRRSVKDMRAEREAMIRRRAPLAAILALEKRIEDAEKIIREGQDVQSLSR